MRKAFAFAFIFIFTLSLLAQNSFCDLCDTRSSSSTSSNLKIQKSNLNEIESLGTGLERYQKLRRDVNQLKNLNRIHLDKNAAYLRDIKAGNLRPSSAAFSAEVSADLQALAEVLVSIESFNQKSSRATPSLQIISEEKIRALQQIKIAILLRNPLLAGRNIKDFVTQKAKSLNFSKISESDVKKLIEESLFVNVNQLLDQEKNCDHFLSDPESPRNAPTASKYLDSVAQKFPLVMIQLIQLKRLNLGSLTASEKNDFCNYEQKIKAIKLRNEMVSIATDIGFIAVGFAAGPLGRGISLASSLGEAKLIEWGLVGISDAYLAKSTFTDYKEFAASCDQNFSEFAQAPDSGKLATLDSCYKNLSNKLVQSSLSVVSGVAPLASGLFKSVSTATSKSIPYVQREMLTTENMLAKSGAVKYSHESGNFTVFDLSHKDLAEKKQLEDLSNKYLDFVSQEYKKRLNLGESEIDSFVESSKAFKDRTTYIISTKPKLAIGKEFGTNTEEVQGGVALVTSQKKSDLLPLEKATGITIDRSEGGVAEIVRLTTAKDSPRAVPAELLEQTKQVILNDPNVQTIYIYTSATHARMYKRGHPYIQDEKILNNGRDVLLKFDVNELRNYNKLQNAG